MKTEQYSTKPLYDLIKRQKAVTLNELKKVLGTTSRATVLRKLKQLGYYSSYSHRGKYYTLKKFARFDAQGIWAYNNILFSKHGTLIDTVEAFVNESQGGFFVQELDRILRISTRESLLKLSRTRRIAREKVSCLYLYCSADYTMRRKQMKARRLLETELILSYGLKGALVPPEEVKGAILLFLSSLNEKQRRLYAGLESLRHGHGGDRLIAHLLGMDVHTVSQGRKELLVGDLEVERVRKKGGGRKSVKKKRQK